VASGLPTHAFYFGGFLPRKAGDRVRALEKLATLDATLVFYESPRRSAATLASLAEALPGRTAVMAREMTKLHEEVLRGAVDELATAIAARELKGEVVLLIGPPARGTSGEPVVPDAAGLRAQVEALVAAGASRKDAVRAVSERTGVPRNAVYDAAIG
jgi:16S rRNA (cytidine1402-2'-O)-methyltransferase